MSFNFFGLWKERGKPNTPRRGRNASSDNHKKLIEHLRTRGSTTGKQERLKALKDYKDYMIKRLEEREEKPIEPEEREKKPILFRYSFKASLPLTVSEKAEKRLETIKEQLKTDKVKLITFPGVLSSDKAIYYERKDGTKKILGVVHVNIEKDVNFINLKHHGVKVRVVGESTEDRGTTEGGGATEGEDLLEFIIQYPVIPTAIQSPDSKNQGDLTYRLRSQTKYGGYDK